MERQYVLSEAQWAVLAPLLPGRRGPAGQDNRRFVEAVLWLARGRAHWRALTPAWGNRHTTYTRFARWAKSGAWGRLLAAVRSRNAGLGTLLLDSTTIRAHQHAAGARKKRRGQLLGRSCGGLSTKLHLFTYALGRPVRALLTASENPATPPIPWSATAIERTFAKLKQFRHFATRYDKRADCFFAWFQVAATLNLVKNCSHALV